MSDYNSNEHCIISIGKNKNIRIFRKSLISYFLDYNERVWCVIIKKKQFEIPSLNEFLLYDAMKYYQFEKF